MNPDDGKIEQFTEEEIQKVNEKRKHQGKRPMILVKRESDLSCRRCQGKGSVWVGKKRKRIRPCKCVL